MSLTVDAKLHFKHTILNFWTKFVQKGYFWWTAAKVNTEY